MSPSVRDVVIREYEPGDEYAITELFGKIFGRTMSLEEWRWKYLGQGNEKVWSFVVLNGHGGLVGHYGGIPLRVRYFDTHITGLVVCDVMIDRMYRGIWMLKALHDSFMKEHLRRGVSLFYGFPTERTLLLPAEKKGLYERVEEVYQASKNLVSRRSVKSYLYGIEQVSFDDRRIDALWRSAKCLRFCVVRDRKYFQWRYNESVLYDYEIWGLRKRWRNDLEGAVIFRKENSETLLLMDMVYERDFFPLVEQTEYLAVQMGKKKLMLWFPQRLLGRLQEIGYTITPSGAILPRANHPRTIQKDELVAHFYYTCGDADFL